MDGRTNHPAEMKRVLRVLASLSVLAMAAIGCDGPTEVAPRVTGQVALYDELAKERPSAGQVNVAALSVSSIRQYQTFTDASGWFDLELPAGEDVPLQFSRDGYGDMYRFGVEGSAEPMHVDMFARSSAAVTSVEAEAEPCGTVPCLRLALEVENFFLPGATRRVFRIFMGADAGVSDLDYEFTDLLVVPNDQPGLEQIGADATFQLDGLAGVLGGFGPGTTVHVVVHGATENLANSYEEPGTGLEIFTDLSAVSARASFVVP
jgi:hypothetical protein